MNPENRYNLRTHGSHTVDGQTLQQTTTPSTRKTTSTLSSPRLLLPTVAMATSTTASTGSNAAPTPAMVVSGTSNSQPSVTTCTRTTPVFANTPRHQLESFSGTNQDPQRWLSWYDRYCAYYRLTEDADKMADFPFHLTEHARAWYDSIEVPLTFIELREMFSSRFQQTHSMDFMAIKQAPSESVQDYFLRLCKCRPNGLSEEWVKGIAIRGLRDDLRTIVMPQNPSSLEAARRASLLAEETLNMSNAQPVASLQPTHFESVVLEQLAQLKLELAKMKETQQVQPSDTNLRDDRWPNQQRFQGRHQRGYHGLQHFQQQPQHFQQQQQPQRHHHQQQQQQQQPSQTQPYQNQQSNYQRQQNRPRRQFKGNGGKHFSSSSFQSYNH